MIKKVKTKFLKAVALRFGGQTPFSLQWPKGLALKGAVGGLARATSERRGLKKLKANLIKAVALRFGGQRPSFAFAARKGLWLAVLLLPVFVLLRASRDVMAIWAPTLGSWNYRQQLNVVNSSAVTLSANTTIAVTVDTKSLISAGKLKSDCSDLRIAYQPSDTTNTVLDRHLVYPSTGSGSSTCGTSTATKVYFSLQASLASSGTSTSYYVYFGNPQASAPTDTDNAFDIGATQALLVCPFEGTTTCAAGETPSTESGAIRYSAGKSALSFDGINDYVTSTVNPTLSDSFTLEAWVYPRRFVSGGDGTNGIMGTDVGSYRLDYNVGSDNRFRARLSIGGVSKVLISNSLVSLNSWTHVAVTYDGANIFLFVNGNESATNTASGSLSNPSSNFKIGLGSNSNSPDAIIDEVRVSNISRYTGNFTPSTTPFVRDEYTKLLLHFDENGDDPRNTGKALDDSGNGNHGTITGAKYVDGLVGVDGSVIPSAAEGSLSSQSYASHDGIFIEEATTNKITNPSFDHGTYDTNWQDGSTNWWLAGGISSANAIAAYQPVGADDLADSYINLANPGTYNAAPGVAPTWALSTGWKFNGSNQYLNTSIVPVNNYAIIARYTSGTKGCVAGDWTTNARMGLGLTMYAYGDGGTWSEPTLSSGVAAITRKIGSPGNYVVYRDGSSYFEGAANGYSTSTGIYLGTAPGCGSYFDGYIQGVAVYNTAPTATQISLITVGVTWAGSGITATENTTAPYYKFGSKSLKLVTTNTGAYTTSVNAGNTNTHTLSAYVYDGTTGNVGGTVSATVAKLVFNGSAVTPDSYTDMGGGWWRLVYDGTGIASAQNFGIEVQAGKTVYVDGIQLEEKAYATTYTDGTLGTGYAWTGTAHESTSTRTISNLQFASTNNISGTTSTATFWFKMNNFNTASSNTFLSTSYNDGTNTLTLGYDGGRIIMQTGGGTVSRTITLTNGNWYFVSAAWTASNVYLSVNGEDLTSAARSSAATLPSTFAVGYHSGWTAGQANSQISDLRIFDSLLTNTQVTDLYNAGLISKQATATTVTVDNFTDRATDGIMTNKITNPSFENSTSYDTNWTLTNPWWLAGGISASNAVAVYQPKGATDYNNSLVNIVNSGTYDTYAYSSVPSWNTTDGWVFNGTDQCLRTGLTNIPITGSIIIKFSNYTSGTDQILAGTTNIPSLGIIFQPNRYGNANVTWKDAKSTAGITSGTLGVSGNIAYKNGVNFSAITQGSDFYTNSMLGIGCGLWSSSPQFSASYVQAFAYYNPTSLTEAQVLAVHNAMTELGTSSESVNTTGTYVKYGNKSTQIVNNTSYTPAHYTTSINAGNTNTHTLSAYVYNGTSGAVGGTVDATVAKLIFNGSAVTTTYTDAGSGWWRLTYASAGSAQASAYGVEVQAGKTVYVDGVQLEESASVTGYIDGSLGTGYVWDGTVNDSTSTRTGSISKGENVTSVWHFDEGYGTTANDASPNLNALTISGATWTLQGGTLQGQGATLQFDGTDDYASRPFDSDFDFGTGAFTISGLFRHPSTISGTDTLLARQSGSTGYKVYMNSSGYMCFSVNSDSVCTTTSYADSKWHSFSAVRSATALTIYIDAISGGTTAQASPATVNGANTLYVGVDSDGASNFWTGFLDELAIYPYARSASQVKVDNLGIQTAVILGARTEDNLTDGLVGWWKMDEASWNGTASEVIDSSGNGNHGTAANGATTATGKFANGGSFATDPSPGNNDDYVNVADATSIQNLPNGDFSVSTYFYDAGGSSYPRLIGKGENYTTYGWIILRSQNAIQFLVRGIGTNYITSTTATVNAWHHLVVTYFNNDKSAKIYIDGKEASYTTATNGSGSYTTDATINLRFGTFDGNWGLTGKLDDVRIYNRALSPAEVDQLYNWAPGPVAHWNFDEGTGTSAYDISGNGNTGTLTNGPTWTEGKYGKAVNFDGSDDLVGAGDVLDNVFTGTNAVFTVEAWIKPSATMTNNYIIAKASDSSCSENQREWGLRLLTASKLEFFWYGELGGASYRGTLGSTAITNTSNWYHVVAQYNGSLAVDSRVSLYVNGIKETTTIDISAGTPTTIPDGTAHLGIGNKTSSTGATCGSTNFNGQIDDVRIYNYARSQKQIIQDMEAGHPAVGAAGGTRQEAVAWYKFDEGYGTTANNSGNGGSALNGTLTNMASPATSTSGWTNSGKFGKGLVFDGSNDFVQINTVQALPSQLTFSSWFKTSTDNKALISNLNAGVRSGPMLWISTGKATYHNGSGNCAQGTTTVTDNVWHHVVLTINGSSQVMYVDGKQEGTSSCTYNENALDKLLIGAYYSSSVPGTSSFNGTMDETKIYNYALSAEEVKLDYNAGSALKLGAIGTTSSNLPSNSSTDSYCPPGQGTACVGPVAEWNFDEGTDIYAYDKSGNDATGTLAGNLSWVNGIKGKAINFPGDAGRVSGISSKINMTSKSALTIQAWVKIDQYQSNWAQIYENDTHGVTLVLNDNGSQYRVCTSANWDVLTLCSSYGSLEINQWYFLTGTHDGTNLRLYINGSLYSTVAGGFAPKNSNNFSIGARSYVGQNIKGTIDKVSLFDYARTPAQIAWDYNRGRPVGWWKMDETEGTTANNAGSTGSGDNGTLTNGVTLMADGKMNYAYTFDGTDDYVDIGSGPTAVNAVSFWVKPTDTTEYPIDINGTAYVWINGGTVTATGFTDATIYVNGKVSSTVTAGVWQHVLVTTDTSLSASDFDIGRIEGVGYLQGQMDDVKIYNYALTPLQIKNEYNGGAVKFGN